MPVAIKAHLHNVCAKNNYELLIAREPTENARSNGEGRGGVGTGARETFARWVLVCADGGTALNHGTKKREKKSRSGEPCALIPGSNGAEASVSTAQNHLPLPNETAYPCCFPSLSGSPFHLLMGKWRVCLGAT